MQRDGVDLDQPEGGDGCGGRDDQEPEAALVARRQEEAAAEEVRADGDEVVAQPVEDAPRRRLAAEPALRDQRVEHDDRAVGDGEPVGRRGERERPRPQEHRGEREREQRLLPG